MQISCFFHENMNYILIFGFYYISLQPNFILNNGNYATGVSSTEFL